MTHAGWPGEPLTTEIERVADLLRDVKRASPEHEASIMAALNLFWSMARRTDADLAAAELRGREDAAASCIFRARRHNSRARLEEATDCANTILALPAPSPTSALAELVKKVRAEEREACAEIARTWKADAPDGVHTKEEANFYMMLVARSIGNAIDLRGDAIRSRAEDADG